MTNLEERSRTAPPHPAAATGPVRRLLASRDVPLGGLRAMHVRRTLPQRDLPLVGAWCFLDEFGPEHVDMRVLPHPHTGLQTVTWPVSGEIHHRDSVGSDVVVRPGQLNLMTAGHGVSHSEMSLGERPLLRGVQLWLALPREASDMAPSFEQRTDLPLVTGDGLHVTVLVGELAGHVSPARVHSPLVGADVVVEPGTRTAVPLHRDFEHAVLVLEGEIDVAGMRHGPGPLLYLGTGRTHLDVASTAGARFLLIGGEPFGDDLVMWWNFLGRSHADVAEARDAWEHDRAARFGTVPGHGDDHIPAPDLPNVRLTPRRRRTS
ncbi:pirin family protein [Cellulomonas sp. P22]|uniref:pirin family protein n=1 Tax=Cellulomonas sp. P22 TaxID=3373189 RepID=UPI0037BA7E72